MSTGYKLTTEPHQKFEITLNSINYSFYVYWVEKSNHWFMDVSNASTGENIFHGEKIVALMDYSDRIGEQLSHVYFNVISDYNEPVDPSRDDFDVMQLFTEPKEFTSSGEGVKVPTDVVVHSGLYVLHDGSYVTHSKG